MPNLQISAPQATFLHDVQVRLQGSGDNIPNTDQLWIVITDVSGGYFPSGNEFCAGPLPPVTGDNTVGQQVSNIFCGCPAPGLQPSTQYFARVERHTIGNSPLSAAPIEVSAEISFTTQPAADPNYWNNTCDNNFSGVPGIQRNELFANDPAMDDGWPCGTLDTLVEIGPSAAGPWTTASLAGFSNPHPSLLGFNQTTGVSDPIIDIAGCAPTFIRYTLYRDGFIYGAHIEEQICGPVSPYCHPQVGCAPSNGQVVVGDTTTQSFGGRTDWNIASFTGNIEAFNIGSGSIEDDPLNQDLYRIRYGTTPGGPYPNVVDSPVTVPSLAVASFGGLQPNTTYYYLIEVYEQNNADNIPQTLYSSAGECTFTTASYGPTCTPATNVTPNSGQLNGTADFVETNRFVRFVWGTTPGGPYPNVTPNQAGTNAGDQFFSETILVPANTTVYYKVQVLDTDGTTVLEEQPGECSFATQDYDPECLPATNITTTEADLHGQADNVPPNLNITIGISDTPGGPYQNTSGGFPGDNTLDQNVDTHVDPGVFAPMAPNTTFYYKVFVLGPGDVILDESDECQFTTQALPAVNTLPPTNVTEQCATMNGQSTDTPAGCTYVFDYGAISGGPYDHTAVAGQSTGASPENFSVTICGLQPNQTIYYRARTICNNQTIAEGPTEEIVTTNDGVYYCGMLFSFDECVFVDPGNGQPYWYCFNDVNQMFEDLAADDRPSGGNG